MLLTLLTSWGLEVVLGETVHASYHQFAGDDDAFARQKICSALLMMIA
jgi:muramoyltetrapeptide carboxypeptidase